MFKPLYPVYYKKTYGNPCFVPFQAIEEGINHMWTVSAFQQHPRTLMICDEDATLDLKVRTVKYFKELWDVHSTLNKEATPDPNNGTVKTA